MKRLIALSTLTILVLVNVTRADYVLGPGLYDNSAPVFTYDGTWFVDEVIGEYYLDTAEYGDSLGAAALSFSMYGDAFTIFVTLWNDGGEALVCIDDICSNVALYSPVESYSSPVTFTGLAVGLHEIEIIPDANGIFFDALLVHGYAEPTPMLPATATPSPTPTETPTLEFTETPTATPTALPWVEYQVTDSMGQEQTVRFEYSTNAGDTTIITFLFALLVLGVIGLIFQVWRYFDGGQ